MRLSLRSHILLTLLPLLLLLAVVGSAGALLLYRLGGSIDAILRENYRSVLYMERLGEAVERIDSALQFALVGREQQAREQYDSSWPKLWENLRKEHDNVTLPGETELVDQLTRLIGDYESKGKTFFAQPAGSPDRQGQYFGRDNQPGLFHMFKEIKTTSAQILDLNQANMEQASVDARHAAVSSLTWFGAGLVSAVIVAGVLAWRTHRKILQPIRAVTQSALEISAGRLDQVVPIFPGEELNQLAQAFNVMARHLRDFRQSQTAQLLRAQQTSQATIDSFPEPVLVIDATGQVELANPVARRMFGVVPGQPGAVWLPPEPLRGPLDQAIKGQHDYLPESFDKVLLLGAGGPERALLPRILTIRDPYGATLGAAVLLQDVTRLRLLDQVKSNLLATASHELKTPLTSIRLAVHLLLEEMTGPLTSKQTELLLDARENCERLLTMINNLLDLARLEQGYQQLDVRPESPANLLQAAADAIGPRAQDKGVEVRVEAPPDLPAVTIDATRIGAALRNLLDNALTYTEPGGHITLSAQASGDNVILAVADTGVGIPAEHLPHVFDKFFRVPGQSRGGGTGLGLAIVNEIVAAHGGTVACESRPGAGTVFRLTLPTTTAAPMLHPVAR